MSYAVICDARKGLDHGISVLALVDRKICRRFWWTSDDESVVLRYRKLDAAMYVAKRLRRNNARVVSYDQAISQIRKQSIQIDDSLANESDRSWDAHKES